MDLAEQAEREIAEEVGSNAIFLGNLSNCVGVIKKRLFKGWVRDRCSLLKLNMVLIDALPQLRYIEKMGCPCGARGESLNTHPHVGGCGVDKLKELALVALKGK